MIPAAWRPFSQIHHISLEEKTVLGWFSADCGPDLHTCPLVGIWEYLLSKWFNSVFVWLFWNWVCTRRKAFKIFDQTRVLVWSVEIKVKLTLFPFCVGRWSDIVPMCCYYMNNVCRCIICLKRGGNPQLIWPYVLSYFLCLLQYWNLILWASRWSMLMSPDLVHPVLLISSFIVSLQGKIGEPGEVGPKGFPVSSLCTYIEMIQINYLRNK